ncbi:MAG: hypothetical protein OXC01_11705 [Immundisolibacterales bacterium]|nr:hypothetical protein [Immundisolibacterales bacterium]
MKNLAQRLRSKGSRNLLAVAIVFAVITLHGRFALPLPPGLHSRYFEAVIAGVVSLPAWWLVLPGMSSR